MNISFVDVVLLVLWLSGSVVVGLMTLCALRLSDSWDYNTNRLRGTVSVPHEPVASLPQLPTSSLRPETIGSTVRWLRFRRFLRRWRRNRWWFNRGPFATSSDEAEVNSSGLGVENDTVHSVFTGSDIYETLPQNNQRQQQSLLQTSSAWPPQPLTDHPLAPVSSSERRTYLDRLVELVLVLFHFIDLI